MILVIVTKFLYGLHWNQVFAPFKVFFFIIYRQILYSAFTKVLHLQENSQEGLFFLIEK